MESNPRHAFWEALVDSAETANRDGKYPDAETLFHRAITVAQENFGPRHINLAHSLLHLGDFLEQQSRFPESESAYKAAAELYESHGAQGLLATTLRNLAQVQWLQGNKTEATQIAPRHEKYSCDTTS